MLYHVHSFMTIHLLCAISKFKIRLSPNCFNPFVLFTWKTMHNAYSTHIMSYHEWVSLMYQIVLIPQVMQKLPELVYNELKSTTSPLLKKTIVRKSSHLCAHPHANAALHMWANSTHNHSLWVDNTCGQHIGINKSEVRTQLYAPNYNDNDCPHNGL